MEMSIRVIAVLIVILIAVLIAAALILQWGSESGNLLDQIMEFFRDITGIGKVNIPSP